MEHDLIKNDIGGQSSSMQIIDKLESGIPVAEFEALAAYLEISVNELLANLRISRSTWHRRKKAGRLDFNMSDKALQLRRLLEYGERVLGSAEKNRLWFKTPSVILENCRPIELIGSFSGMNLINDELLRIEHGVYF